MEDVINLHIESDSKSIKMGNKFILENEDIKLEYRKYLEKKYGRYKKEFDILNDFLLINPIIKINSFIINNESDFKEQEFFFNINNKINGKITYGKVNIDIEGVKKFHIEFPEYNMKDKNKFPEVKIKKTKKDSFEAEDIMSYFFNDRIEKDLSRNLKKFFIKIIAIKNCIQKEYTTNNNIISIFDKDLLNMSSEDIDFSMITTDYQVKPLLENIQDIVAGNPIIKQSKKIK